MKTTLRSDRRKNPELVEYRLLSFEDCKALTGHCNILDQQGKIASVKITSVKTWKSKPNCAEVHYKFGMYEYGTVYIHTEIHPNTELVAIIESESS